MRQAKDFYGRFERIVSFIVAGKVKKYYGTVQQYVLALALKSKSPNHPSLTLHISRQILDSLSRTRDGGHHLREFAARMSPFMRYHPHVCRRFPSGKVFERASWFEPDEKWLRQVFKKGISSLLTAEDQAWLARRLDRQVQAKTSEPDDKRAGLNPDAIQAIPRNLRKSSLENNGIRPSDDMPEECRGLDWTLKDVQLAVDKNVLSLSTARHVASVVGLDGHALRDSPTGYCWEDERRNYLIRAKVIHEALQAYAPAKNTWLDDGRAKSYRILQSLARDIIQTLKHGGEGEIRTSQDRTGMEDPVSDSRRT